MNRTIKTIAGAAVLVSAVSLVPAFSVGAITLDEYYEDASTPVITNGLSEKNLTKFTLADGTILFAASDANGEDQAAAAILLSTGSSLKTVITGSKVVFTIDGDATVKNDLVLDRVTLSGTERSMELVVEGQLTFDTDKYITINAGSALSISKSGAMLASANIINNGDLNLSKTNAVSTATIVNGATGVITANGDITINKLTNNGKINTVSGKTLTISNLIDNAGEINVVEGATATISAYAEGYTSNKITVAPNATLNLAADFAHEVTLQGRLDESTVVTGTISAPGFNKELIIIDATDNREDAKALTKVYSWVIKQATNTFTLTTKNDTKYVTTLKIKDNTGADVEKSINTWNANATYEAALSESLETRPTLATAESYVSGGKTYVHTCWQIQKTVLNAAGTGYVGVYIDSLTGGETTTDTGNPVLIDFDLNTVISSTLTIYAKYEQRNSVSYIVVLPGTTSEDWETETTIIDENITTFGQLIGSLEDELPEGYTWKIYTLTDLGDKVEIEADHAIIDNATIFVEGTAKPAKEEPGEDEGSEEEKTPTVTVTGDAEVDATEEELLANIVSSLELEENAAALGEISEALASNNVDFAVEAAELSGVDEATQEAIEKKTAGKTVLGYYDIRVSAYRKDNGEFLANITNLDTPLTLKIKLSEEDRKVAEGYSRTYVVVRVHGSDVSILEATLDEDGYLVFESGLFSTYAVAYTDTKIATVTPNDEDEETPEVVDPTKDATVADGAGFISTEKSAAAAGASIFAIVAAAITAAGVAISKLFKKSER